MRRFETRGKLRRVVGYGAIALLLVACSKDSEPQDSMEGFAPGTMPSTSAPVETTTSSISTTTTSTTAAPETVPREQGEVLPVMACDWSNENPQPPADEDPYTVVVDGRCRTEPQEKVLLYAEPREGSQLVAAVDNGYQLPVYCAATQGQELTDARGPESASKVWVKVKTPVGDAFIWEGWVGYINEARGNIC